VGKAVFGFGLSDNEVISRGIAFPLFVRAISRKRTRFTYLGNYTAEKLDPVAWEGLSEEVCLFSLPVCGVSGPSSN